MKTKIFVMLIALLLFPTIAFADHIYKIDMTIDLLEDGSANITEVWDVKASSGSEWYKQLYDMGNEELSNFKAYMDDEEMTYKNWNVNESLSEKRGYYGINYVSDGLELCFGKGDMQRHTFKLTYTLSNMIFNVSDAQVFYQTLFPNVTLDHFTVMITSYYEFPDTLDVWGYGGQYLAYVADGKIILDSENYSLNNDYVTVLVKFPVETFRTSNSYSWYTSFDEILDTANDGTWEYDYTVKVSLLNKILNFLSGIAPFAFFFAIIGVSAKTAINSGYGYIGNKKIDKKEVPMWRDIPCDKDIYYANALTFLNNFDFKETNILGAIILKWIKNDKVTLTKAESGILKKEVTAIDLNKDVTLDNELEEKLFKIMRSASKDGILEPREFQSWARSHYDKFFSVFKSIKNDAVDKLESAGHVRNRTDKKECSKKHVMDDKIYEDSVKLYGLKKYLIEFSNMKDKDAIEVKLWDEYLMFAYIFGIADKVAAQLKNLHPEVMQNPEMDYNTIVYVNNISRRSVSAASAARSAAESYSSGGGGFSSGGGGGGSFGGGGSMGGR